MIRQPVMAWVQVGCIYGVTMDIMVWKVYASSMVIMTLLSRVGVVTWLYERLRIGAGSGGRGGTAPPPPPVLWTGGTNYNNI
jgi:hypothetical protein